jgi:hypothetical protein
MSNERPRTAAQVTLTALFFTLCVLTYLFGLFVGLLGFCPGKTCGGDLLRIDALILLGVLALTSIATMTLVARGRAPWVVPLIGLGLIVGGWVLTYWHAGFTAFGV